MLTPKIDTIERLKAKWGGCVTCRIGTFAVRKAFLSGSKQPHFLFIGEGPGVSEDTLGEPFVGPAGRLLKKALVQAGFLHREYALTNLVLCRPSDGPKEPNRPPSFNEVQNCLERLNETIAILKPKTIVAVGLVPAGYLKRVSIEFKYAIRHPAYVLRRGGYKSPDYPDYIKSLLKLRRVYGEV